MESTERKELQKIVDRLNEIFMTVGNKDSSESFIIYEIRGIINRNKFVKATFEKEFGIPLPMSDQLPFTSHGRQYLESDIKRLKLAIINDYLK